MSFSEFFEVIKTASFGFEEIFTAISGFCDKLLHDFNISELFSGMWWHLRYVKPFVPVILFALWMVIAVAGKRLFGIIRFLAIFGIGFILGVYTLSPLVLEVLPTLPTWVIGLITGIVAGVLSKVVYLFALIVTVGYGTYVICYRGAIPFLSSLTAGKEMVGLIAAIVLIVLSLVLLKYVEMLGTAMLGGYGMACIIRGWYDYTSLPVFVGREWLGVLILTVIFAVIGFFIQFKTRERYN